ncbi:hypothetical protein BASA81_006217 [Batrachochytrium salamandrivorans]|nr:hypothetical protein BASA81_006217 [Batrachochytrium salamandrivorans]
MSLEKYLDSLALGVDGKKPAQSPFPPLPASKDLPPPVPSSSFFKRRVGTSKSSSTSGDDEAKPPKPHSRLSGLFSTTSSSHSKSLSLPKLHLPSSSAAASNKPSPSPTPTAAASSMPAVLVTSPPPLPTLQRQNDSDISNNDVVSVAEMDKQSNDSANDLLLPDTTKRTGYKNKTKRRSRGSGDLSGFVLAPTSPTATVTSVSTPVPPPLSPRVELTLPDAIKRIQDMDTSLEASLLSSNKGALLVAKTVKPEASLASANARLQVYNDKRLGKLWAKMDKLEEDLEQVQALALGIQSEIKSECTKLCDGVNKLTQALQSDSESLKQREVFFRTTTQKIERELRMIPEKVSDAVESKEKAYALVLNEMDKKIHSLTFQGGDSVGVLDSLAHSMQEFFLLGGGMVLKLVASLVVLAYNLLCCGRKTRRRTVVA